MEIAIAQMKCSPGDVAANVTHLQETAVRAAGQGAQALIFPEVCDTGYNLKANPAAAGTWPGTAYDAVQQAAASQKLWMIGGLSEKTEDGIYNALVVFDPEGTQRVRYRKIHLFSPAGEAEVFNSGSELSTLLLGDLTWGFLICYDLRFPELSRSLVVQQGADVLVYVSAWPAARQLHWNQLVRARAIENQAYVLGANRTGTDAGLRFAGQSAAIDPYGEILAEAPADEEALLRVSLDRKRVTEVREALPALKDRRPDLY